MRPALTFAALAALVLLAALRPSDETDGWFPLDTSARSDAPPVFDASGWLDAPAGRHGRVTLHGDAFAFADGTPVRFWGVNIADRRVYAPHAEADRWAAYLAQYGVNSVRFHKFTWSGYAGLPTSTNLRADRYERLDYFSAALRKRGIYYGWSHIFAHQPQPADSSRMLAYAELKKAGNGFLAGSTYNLVNFAPDLQDLHIALTVNMLRHRNPYTGLRYADDPALSFLELQNEDDIYWASTDAVLKQTPTYRALLCRQFSDWLRRKYRTEARLRAAWGEGALKPGESLADGTIYPEPNPGLFEYEFQKADREGRRPPQHLLDKARFLYEVQISFYDRFVRAVRQAGYRGPIVASCWQAGAGLTNYYNLHADYRAGFIDRHNYFGGGTGHVLTPGTVEPDAMVRQPGAGLLSTGLQQVAGRPFAMSEWMAMAPNEYTAEAAPIIAAYGMGLQGWDASYAYASNAPHLSSVLQAEEHGVYNVDSPLHMGLYPALARMVYRGDVKEGAVLSARNVYVPGLADGRLGFRETVSQQGDVKAFGGAVPPALLAAGRAVVRFTDRPEPTRAPDLSAWIDSAAQVVRSTTGQLAWHYGPQGFFTIDTPGTQGVVGFAGGRTHRLADLALDVETPFATVLVTSLDRDRPIRTARRVLVTTVARARNTGMRYAEGGRRLEAVGTAPLLLEPVRLTLALGRRPAPVVYVLDHTGRRTGRTLTPEADGRLRLDGAETRTLYYELAWGE